MRNMVFRNYEPATGIVMLMFLAGKGNTVVNEIGKFA